MPCPLMLAFMAPSEQPHVKRTEVRAVLRKARALIAKPGTLSHEYYAADKHGNWMDMRDFMATRFSITGAIYRVTGGRYAEPLATAAISALAHEIAPNAKESWVTQYGEKHRQPDVLALYDKAIARLGGAAHGR